MCWSGIGQEEVNNQSSLVWISLLILRVMVEHREKLKDKIPDVENANF